MSVSKEVRDYLLARILKVLAGRRLEIQKKIYRISVRMQNALLKQDENIQAIDQGIYAYNRLGEQIEALKEKQEKLGKETEKSFNTLSKVFHVRSLDIDGRYHWVPTGEVDRYGHQESTSVNFDNCELQARDAFNLLKEAMVLDAALEEAGLTEDWKQIKVDEGEVKEKLFLALNVKALRDVLAEVNKRFGLELSV